MKAALDDNSIDLFFLPRESSDAQIALRTGFLARAGGKVEVRATELLRRSNGAEEILFRKCTYPVPKSFGERITRALAAARIFSLTATLMPCLAVWAEGTRRGDRVNLLVALSALAGALFLQLGVNLYNDVFDYQKLIDLPGTPGGSGVIEKGWFTPEEIRKWARIAVISGVLSGIPALIIHPLEILVAGGLGTLGALVYSHPRAGLKYRGLGDLAVFALCGPVLTVGFSIAAFNVIIPSVIPIGVFLGLLACALLHVNNLHDIDFDRSRGAITLAGRIGFVASVRLLIALYIAAAIILIAGTVNRDLPLTVLPTLLVSFIVFPLARRVLSAMGPSSPTLEGARMTAAKIHLLAGLALTLGILASRWTGA